MLHYSCIINTSSPLRRHFFSYKIYFSKLSYVKLKKEENSLDVDPPLKRYRNSTSIIRALISCVQPVPEAPNFYLGPDFSHLSKTKTRLCMLAKAKGRLAARVSARDFFPNDITALSKEIPLIDRWIPIQTPDSIVKRAMEGSLSNDEAMERLILLLAPRHSWKLYNEIAPDYKWTANTLHRLLDLLCVTNSGRGGAHPHVLLNNYDWSNLPDPDEIYLTHHFNITPYNDRQIIAKRNELENTTNAEINDEFTDNNVSSGEVNNWSLDTQAEKLFHKEFNILNTPAGYRSMIRGAARFGNADRAFELTKLAWESKHGDKCLDLATYNQLIRCLHQLTIVKNDEENIWDIIVNILEHVKICGDPINISIFTNILYTLAQASVQVKSTSHLSDKNYVSIGLGLLSELKRLNLKPELGTLANLLLLIYRTPAPVNRSSTSTTNRSMLSKNLINNNTDYSTYKCSDLIDNLLNEVEIYFNNNNINGTGGSPQRFDAWTMDDYTFFPIAMKCALNETNVKLGQRIHNLLTHYEDRTFLLSNNHIKRDYLHNYCKLMFQFNESNVNECEQLIERYHNTYCHYPDVVLSSKGLLDSLMKNYKRILNLCDSYAIKKLNIPSTIIFCEQNISSMKLSIYNHLCRLLNDLLNIEFIYYLQINPSTIEQLTLMVCERATINPKDALDLSMKITNILKKLDNDLIRPISNTSTTGFHYDDSGVKIDQSFVEKYKQFVAFMVNKCTKLCFPIFEELSVDYNNNNKNSREEYLTWKTKLINTLYDWFRYAEKHNSITWEWALKGLYILWREDDFIQVDFMWNVIECLVKQDEEFTNCVTEQRNLLEPMLNTLEKSILKTPQQDIESIEKLKCLQSLRNAFQVTDSTNTLPLYSNGSIPV
ncbi:unnamed protein product [Schistosoma turkestanicum]|nr:unnamed protein product [Schistosoma turkestanicum]